MRKLVTIEDHLIAEYERIEAEKMCDSDNSSSSSDTTSTHNQDTSSPPEAGPIIREHFGLRADLPAYTATNAEWDRLQVAKAEAADNAEWTPFLSEVELEERRARLRRNYPVHSKKEISPRLSKAVADLREAEQWEGQRKFLRTLIICLAFCLLGYFTVYLWLF